MTKLREFTENFTVSRPVFHLQLDDNGRNIRASISSPKYKYRPTLNKDSDPLYRLVCEHYNEHFDVEQGAFTLDKNDIANRAMQQIRNSIAYFIEKNLEMRNPRQSKLYRWAYRNMPNGSDFNDVLVMVYKYLRSFSDPDMKANETNHINNGIAILEAIMEKYEQR